MSMEGSYSEGTLRESPGQTHIEWRISNFSKYLLNRSSKIKSKGFRAGYFLNSPTFSVSDAKWFIRMYPNGQTETDTAGWISVYLWKKESLTEQRIAFRIGMKNTDGSELIALQMKHTFEKEKCMCGWDKFVEHSTPLKADDTATSDDSLTVFCTARVLHSKDAPSLSGLLTLSENFKDLYVGSSFSDVTIFVQDKKFFAHRNILASRSKVFASMFQQDMVEKRNGTVDIIDCDPESFEEFLLYIYSGRTDNVSSRNALNLYETANKYDLKELMDECAECLAREVSVSSFCDIVRLAYLYHESDLLEAATKFFIDNAEIIIKTTEWQSFLDKNTSLGSKLFLNFLQSKKV